MTEVINPSKKYFASLDIAKFGCSIIILLYHYFSEYGHAPAWFEEGSVDLCYSGCIVYVYKWIPFL